MLRRLLDWFTGPRVPPGPTLRNRVGGMAWIKGLAGGTGAETLNGRAVKTVRINVHGSWDIDPPQDYVATVNTCFTPSGNRVEAGAVALITGVPDAHLEPWKEDEDGVTDEEVRDLFEPDRLIAKPVSASVIRGH